MVGDFKNITIVGLGMIGGSIAKALKAKGFEGNVYGLDRDNIIIEKAYNDGVIHNSENDSKSIISKSDLVIMATPVGFFPNLLQSIKDDLKQGCIITDVGSVKKQVHEIANKILGQDYIFIGGHPMIGSEKSGLGASKPHLFENAYYFVTGEEINNVALDRVKEFVEFLGAKVCTMTATEHDRVVARTSHIPHLTASLLVNLLDENSLIDYVGGGFRDTTRIASGDPEMWGDIIINNKTEILSAIDGFMQQLEQFKKNLIEENQEEIVYNLNKAKEIRENIPKHLIDSIEPEYAVIIDVKDQPGVIAAVSGLMAKNNINIKDIEILHARETAPGVLKVGFYNKAESDKAEEVLMKSELNYLWKQ